MDGRRAAYVLPIRPIISAHYLFYGIGLLIILFMAGGCTLT